MATNTWTQRLDSLKPNQPVTQRSYAIKMFEGDNIGDLQLSSNLWLWTLPTQQNEWQPHLVSTDLTTYQVTTGPNQGVRYVMTLTVYLEGINIGPSPTGF